MNRPGTTHDVTAPTELDDLPEGTVLRLKDESLILKTGIPGTGWQQFIKGGHVSHTVMADNMPLQILYVPSPPPPAIGSYLATHDLEATPVGSVVIADGTVFKKVGDDKFEGIGVTEDGSPVSIEAVQFFGPVKLLHDGT